MIKSISLVLALSVIGDTLADGLQLPAPGAAIGLILLTGLFVMRGGPDASTAKLFDSVSPVFPMFFVPAAVGIVANAQVLAQVWLYVAIAIGLGTAVTIAVTGVLAQSLLGGVTKAHTV